MVLFKGVGFGAGFICSWVKKNFPQWNERVRIKKKFVKIYVGYVINRNEPENPGCIFHGSSSPG
jgi:hypothetical protein